MSDHEIDARRKLIAHMVLKLEARLSYMPEPHQTELRAEAVKCLSPESSDLKAMAASA